MLFQNKPSRASRKQLEHILSTLRDRLRYVCSILPDHEKQMREQLNKLDDSNFACSEQNITEWSRNLAIRIRESNCDTAIYEALGTSLVYGLKDIVSQEALGEKSEVEEPTPVLTPVIDELKECVRANFEKIWGTDLSQNASPPSQTSQEQQLEKFEAAFWILNGIADLIKIGIFDRKELKEMIIRTAELLNFSASNTELGQQRLEAEDKFFRLVAGQIIPYMQGQREVEWEDSIRNYPNSLKEYLRSLKTSPDGAVRPLTGLLIEKFLTVFKDETGIDQLYQALQTQASGSQ